MPIARSIRSHRLWPSTARRASVLLVAALAQTLFITPAQAQTRPAQDEIIYQIMPIAWRDSNNDTSGATPTRFGDFGGLASAASLDYLQNLGVTTIYLQPIFPSAAYHGYQHGPADQLNARFGTEAEFQALINAVHARGMKIVLDYVAYGISHNSTYFISARNNPASTYDSWLAFTNAANTTYTGSVYNTWNGASVGFIHWNLATPAAVTTVTNWATKWLDPNNDGDTSDGIDGYRLDHIYSNAPEGWGATIGFWQTWCSSLRAVKPGIFIFGEPGDWGNYGTDLLTPTGFDGVLTKPFEFAARDAVKNEVAAGLYSSVASTLAAVPANKTVVAQTNDHDSDRIASYWSNSLAKQKVGAAVLMTQPFPPNIYFGDEIGMRGAKATFGSDANDIPMREPFKWFATAAAPMSNYYVLNTAAYNGRTSQNNDGRSVQEQQGVAGSVLETYRSLIWARRNSVALRRGDYTAVTNSSPAVWSFVRTHADQQVLVAINLSGVSVATSLNLGAFGIPGGTTTPVDLVSGVNYAALTPANKSAYSITLPANSYAITTVALTPPPPPPPPPADIDGRSIPTDATSLALRATQACPTSFANNVGELNQLFVRPAHDGLRISVTGNIPTDGTAVVVLLQTNATGSATLQTGNQAAPPGGLPQIAGTVMDTGFAPNQMFFVNCSSGNIYADQLNLSPTTSVKTYRGQGLTGSGVGTLTGGTNPAGLLIAIDNTNTAGVTTTSAATAATATRGVEMLIPYADIALNPSAATRAGQTIRLSVALTSTTGTWGNQWLPSLPAASGPAGLDPNLNSFAGQQFATLTLPPAADYNGDGLATLDDLYAWHLKPADADGSGSADTTDAIIIESGLRAAEAVSMVGSGR